MPPAGQSQGGEPDNSFAALWMTIGLFVLFAAIWYFFNIYIIRFVFFVRYYEAYLISFLLPTEWTQPLIKIQQFIHSTQTGGYQTVTFTDMSHVSTIVGNYLRFPVALGLILLAIKLYKGNAISRFKKTYSMQRLLTEEKETWPQIMPIAKLNLVDEDLNTGPWAMSLSPMHFAKKYNLLIVEKILPADVGLKNRLLTAATIDRDETRKVFTLQVGPYWTSPEALPIHIRALLAVFAARINGEREAPTDLLMQIAASSAKGKLDFSGADALLQKHVGNKQVQKLIRRHAFVMTVMAAMLALAREDGVLPSSDFLWLKPLDRRLWFMLNSVGRQTPFSEVAGPFAHWLAEKEIGRRLNVPMIEEAVNGLAEAMKEIIYKPEEEES
jgi:intracellular multiplication protein IcmP